MLAKYIVVRRFRWRPR